MEIKAHQKPSKMPCGNLLGNSSLFVMFSWKIVRQNKLTVKNKITYFIDDCCRALRKGCLLPSVLMSDNLKNKNVESQNLKLCHVQSPSRINIFQKLTLRLSFRFNSCFTPTPRLTIIQMMVPASNANAMATTNNGHVSNVLCAKFLNICTWSFSCFLEKNLMDLKWTNGLYLKPIISPSSLFASTGRTICDSFNGRYWSVNFLMFDFLMKCRLLWPRQQRLIKPSFKSSKTVKIELNFIRTFT